MYYEIKLICPICTQRLYQNEKSCICEKNHSFDIARQGYVNLLPVQNKHSLSPGDTKAMLAARRSFLGKGFYEPIRNAVTDRIRYYTKNPVLVDIGCGEGYYTAAFEKICGAKCIGIDIAKDAARMACAESKSILWAVATASHLPIESGSADIVTAIFSLYMNDEYARVLRSGGIVIEVTAGSKHLTELKQLIYDEVFDQHKSPAEYGGQFEQLEISDETFEFELNNSELKELLMMTPHAHRIKKEKSNALETVDRLRLTANYIIRVLRKI